MKDTHETFCNNCINQPLKSKQSNHEFGADQYCQRLQWANDWLSDVKHQIGRDLHYLLVSFVECSANAILASYRRDTKSI